MNNKDLTKALADADNVKAWLDNIPIEAIAAGVDDIYSARQELEATGRGPMDDISHKSIEVPLPLFYLLGSALTMYVGTRIERDGLV